MAEDLTTPLLGSDSLNMGGNEFMSIQLDSVNQQAFPSMQTQAPQHSLPFRSTPSLTNQNNLQQLSRQTVQSQLPQQFYPTQVQTSTSLFGDDPTTEYPSGFVSPGFNQLMAVLNSQNGNSNNTNVHIANSSYAPIKSDVNTLQNDVLGNFNVSQNNDNYNINLSMNQPMSAVSLLSSTNPVMGNQRTNPLMNKSNMMNVPVNTSFTIEEVDFKDEFSKRQSRAQREKCQRVEDGDIKIFLNFPTKSDSKCVNNVVVYLQRTNESKLEVEKRFGNIPLKLLALKKTDDTKIYVHVDLDSIHEQFGTDKYKKIYDLDRSNKELNKYHLSISVSFSNGQIGIMNSKCFQILGRNPNKRTNSQRKHSVSASPIDFLPSMYSTSEDGSPEAKRQSKDIHAHQLFADHIKTNTLVVEGRFEVKVMQSEKGDIAYHFKLKNKNEAFEEGEIVVFVESEFDDRTLVVEKLNYKNASKAALRGVVTRSQYFEAHFPTDDYPTETIAVCGIVPVKVKGVVGPNEGLYASLDYPGVAISDKSVNTKDFDNTCYIGYTVNGCNKNTDENSINLVETFVSIYQTASLMKINDRLSSINRDMEEKFYAIKKEQRKRKRICIGTSIVATIFLCLLGIFLWQYFVPGSRFRYYKCKIGRKVPHGFATFHFIPLKNIFWYPEVNGIEYEYNKLLKSMHKTDYKPITDFFNGTGFRFYKNIDRCAYARISDTADITTGAKQVAGPELFAVDSKCFHAYYYNEGTQQWRKYNSVSWVKRKNIFCKPRSKYKHFIKGDPSSY